MVREIVELEQLNREDSSGLKTHNEILELIGEIKSIEDKLKDPELLKEIPTEKGFVKQELEQTETTEELTNEVQFLEVQTKSESNEETQLEKKKDKRHKINFPIKIRWKRKPEGAKTWHSLRDRNVKPDDNGYPEFIELQDQPEEIKPDINSPINSTFTLRIDDQGALVGLNIKKPKPEKKLRELLSFGKSATKESGAEATEEPGIKGKIKGLLSRIKPKQSGESGGSKISILLGKIKGVLPKR